MFLDEYGRSAASRDQFPLMVSVKYFLADGDIVIFPSHISIKKTMSGPYYGDSRAAARHRSC